MTSEARSRSYWILGLVLITAVASCGRWWVFDRSFPVALTGDEMYYARTSAHLALGRGHGTGGVLHADWPPAHSFVLSWFMDAKQLARSPGSLTLLRSVLRVEVALGTLLVLLITLLGRALFDRRTALAAGAIAALYPTFIGYSHTLWSETLFLTLEVAAFLSVVLAARRRSLLLAALAGALFGGAALTREIGLLFAGAAAIWFLVEARSAGPLVPVDRVRQAWARAAILLTVTVVVVLPWTVRNHGLFGRVVPVSTIGWMGICEGNTLGADDWLRPDMDALRAFRGDYFTIDDRMQRQEFARTQALERIRAQQPLWLPKKFVRNTALLFSPDSFLFKKISRKCYGELELGRVRTLLALHIVLYLLVIIAGTLGIAASTGGARRLLPLLVFGILLALHVFAHASSRYRLPIMPFLMVYGAHALTHGRSLVGSMGRTARILCAIVLLYFLAWCVPYFAQDALALWKTGAYVDPDRS